MAETEPVCGWVGGIHMQYKSDIETAGNWK